MEEKQSRNSLFVGIPGLCTLLFFAVTALYFQAWLVSSFLFLFFFLCLSSYAWSRGICRHVEIRTETTVPSCYAGEQVQMNLTVKNKSLFPLVWLDVILPTGKKPVVRQAGSGQFGWYYLKGKEYAETGIRERFVWLLWQQEISWSEKLETVKRGVVCIDGIGLQAGDGFGLSAKEDWYDLSVPVRILIYPRLVPVQISRFLKITQEAVSQNKGQTEDITILKSSRPYQPGDPMKKINWRLLASSGQMNVNIYETIMPGCAAFILDLAGFSRVIEHDNHQGGSYEERIVLEKRLEQMISLAASLMTALAKRQVQCALILPAFGEQEAVIRLPAEGESSLLSCMEALAMLDYHGEETIFPYEEFWQSCHKMGTVYICTRTDGKNEFEELAARLGQSRVSFLVQQKTGQAAVEGGCIYAEDICGAACFHTDGEEEDG
ncbi:DUF58 domain-containing protein [Clostridium sp. MCC353]|uniref:DUF58 domain-containing protein n=1 Tax=Clostridium sp. MCC353 TaxID=2592646 RepID=UPI001C017B15|nr:DUF58 domain-containing protein [Clostridium sp. MCC353]